MWGWVQDTDASFCRVHFASDHISTPPTKFHVRQIKVIDSLARLEDVVTVTDPRHSDFGDVGKVEMITEDGLVHVTNAKHGRSRKSRKRLSHGPYQQWQLHLTDAHSYTQSTDAQYEFECYSLFVVVEKLRSAVSIDRADMRLLDVVVRNEVLYEWFTDRIGQTEVVRHGRVEPLFFTMPARLAQAPFSGPPS